SPVTYLIELSSHPKRTQIYHVNLLKKWEQPKNVTIRAADGFFITPSTGLGLELYPMGSKKPVETPCI
ncbi:hypothetical protein NDU88_003762, partial [Pleurodeles waltl]